MISWLWQALLMATVAAAPPPDVEVVIHARLPAGSLPAGELVLTRSDHRGGTRRLPLAATVPVRLPERSVWEVLAHAPDHWGSPTAFVAVAHTQVHVHLWPLARVEGRWRWPEGVASRPAPQFTGDFRSIAGAETPFFGRLPCEKEGTTFRCPVPAAPLDLTLKAPGLASELFWELALSPGATVPLPPRTLRPGASVLGWVEDAAGRPREAEVTLTPTRPGVGEVVAGEDGSPRRAVLLRGRSTPRGVFQFAGLPAGEYALVATGPAGEVATLAPVSVRLGEETELRYPLRLHPLARLAVRVQPPRHPSGSPWRLVLFSLSSASAAAAETTTDAHGRASFSSLQAGTYHLEAKLPDHDQAVWAAVEVTLPEQDEVELAIPLVLVKGRVFLDEKPLPGVVAFGGSWEQLRVALESDHEGRFSGHLPRAGSWRVAVAGRRVPILTETTVEVPQPRGGTPAHVEIRCRSTRVSGQVVDQEGQPQAGAQIEAASHPPGVSRHPGGRSQGDGLFTVLGLPPGRVALRAHHQERSSEPVTVVVPERGEVTGVRLQLRPPRELRGRVVGPWGPAGGIPVMAILLSPLPSPGVRVTEADGSFSFHLGVEPGPVAVVAFPEFGTLAVACASPSGPLEVATHAVGGTLELHGLAGLTFGAPLAVRYQGCAFFSHVLLSWQRHSGSGSPLAGVTAIPRLPPGVWELCWWDWEGAGRVRWGPCAGGLLPPHGTLTLAVPTRGNNPS